MEYLIVVSITSTEYRTAVVEAESREAARQELERQVEEVDVWAATKDHGQYGDTEWAIESVKVVPGSGLIDSRETG